MKKKVLVFTITKNRLDFFKKYYNTFKEKNKNLEGVEIHYIIVDNGSDQDMKDHLLTMMKDHTVIFNKINEGITSAWLKALRWAKQNNYDFDYFVKFDPDIKVESSDILKKYIAICRTYGDKYIAAPVDLNIHPDYVPRKLGQRRLFTMLGAKDDKPLPFLLTTHIGGACSFYTKRAMKEFQNVVIQPKGDMERGIFFRKKGFEVGYFETLSMSHMGVVPEAKNYPPEKYVY